MYEAPIAKIDSHVGILLSFLVEKEQIALAHVRDADGRPAQPSRTARDT